MNTSELGARIDSAPLVPWPLTQGAAAGPLVALLVGLVFVGVATAFYLNGLPTPAFVFGAVALPFVLGGVGGLRRRGELRGTLTVHEDGFIVEQNGRRTSAQWADVQSICVKEKEWLANGDSRGLLREVRATAAGRTFVLPNATKLGEDDPFARALSAILGALGKVAERRLDAAGSLTGAGWALTQAGLRTQSGSTYAFMQLSGVGIWESRARIWVEGRDEPVLDLPAHSPNARLLLLIASRRMPDRQGQPVPVTGFGRRLFAKRSSSYVVGWMLAGLAACLTVPAGVILSEPYPDLGAAAGLGVSAAVVGALAWRLLQMRVFIHERGVKMRGFLGMRELEFSQVAVFNYGATRQYYNGAYSGTVHKLALTPAQKGAGALSFALTTQGTDVDVEKLRDTVATLVADRLYDALQAEGALPWSGATLAREGIRFQPTKLLGGKQPEQLLPYTLVAHAFHDGQMLLFGENHEKPLVTLSCAGHNFYPGLQVYFRMCEEATRRARGGVVISA